MKYFKIALLTSVIVFNTSAFATGGKKVPPQAMSFFDQIIAMFVISG